MKTLNLREKFSAFVLMSVGIIYLIVFIISFGGNQSAIFSSTEENININKSELLNHIRSLIIILSCIPASILLLRIKKFGWISAMAILPVFLIMLIGGWYEVLKMELYDNFAFILLCLGSLIILSTAVFLVLPSCLKKFGLNRNHYIVALSLSILFCTIFFLL